MASKLIFSCLTLSLRCRFPTIPDPSTSNDRARKVEAEALVSEAWEATKLVPEVDHPGPTTPTFASINVTSDLSMAEQNGMKNHQVTVRYRSTQNLNDAITGIIGNLLGLPQIAATSVLSDVELDYLRITSDRDGV